MISYDSNVLVYALQATPEYFRQAVLILKEGTRKGAVLSVLIKHEMYEGAALRGGDAVGVRKALESLDNVQFIPVDEEVIDRSVLLTQKYGKKCRRVDALMIATAIEHGAERFYTNDHALQKCGITEIDICSLA